MTPKQLAAAKAQAAYHAAADNYDHPALSFWDRFGRDTIARLPLTRSARVLDVCCGSGASALPAAVAVGNEGCVLGVDLAPGLIDLARAKAQKLGLSQARFITGDFEELGEPDGGFDAVVCVFGIFFVPDMPGAVRRLWRYLRPGGRLAITTWGSRVFEPANTIFWEAVQALRPEFYKGFNPWDRISTPDAVVAMLAEGGVIGGRAEAVPGWHPLSSGDDWWQIVMGSGYRGIIEQLSPTEQARLKQAVLGEVDAQRIDRIEANVIYASADKPQIH